MRNLITLVLLSFIAVCWGQQYSFPIYFEDAKGNKDTLLIGFDVEATHGVDEKFGEINFLGKKQDTVFNVVFSDKNFNPKDYDLPSPISYQLKKQILPRVDTLDNIYTLSSVVEIDVTCNNWPIKISWDSTLLKGTFYSKMILAAHHHPGGWFDVGPITGDGLPHEMPESSSLFYTEEQLCVDNEGQAFFYVGWFDLLSSTPEKFKGGDIIAYPNPFNETMTLKMDNQKTINKVAVVNLLGVKLMEIGSINKKEVALDFSLLSQGVYQLIITNDKGEVSSRVIKKM